MIRLGLIGHPIIASLSPQIHSAALKESGLDGEYKLYPIAPDDIQGLKKLLNKVRAGEIHGLNITIPHKQNIIPLVDDLSDTAKSIGAINTISLKDGKLIGDNTDAPGFWNDLQELLRPDRFRKPVRSPKALILGAGGSARAVAYALLQNGWNVTVAARRIEQAKSLQADFKIAICELNKNDISSITPQLILNTTPIGMKSHPQGSPWPEELGFPTNAALYELIYNPAETQLMKDAAQAGLPTCNGLGMLIEQALLSFEIWTEKKVPVEKIILEEEDRLCQYAL